MRRNDFLHDGFVTPADLATMLRNAVGQHRVAPPTEPEARIESQAVPSQMLHVQEQIARRRAADHRPRRPSAPPEDADVDDPRIDRPGEFVLHGSGHGGTTPCRPARDQVREPLTDREFVVIDEHQRVGVGGFGQRPVPRGGNARFGLMDVPDAAPGPTSDLRRRTRIGIVVDDEDRGARIDVRSLAAECLDCARQQVGPTKGGHRHRDSRAAVRLLRHETPPTSGEEHKRVCT
jgi:hypothetical protein